MNESEGFNLEFSSFCQRQKWNFHIDAVFGHLQLGSLLTAADFISALILKTGGIFVMEVARLSLATTGEFFRIATLERDALRDPVTGVFKPALPRHQAPRGDRTRRL
ncbi:hypothetical protein ONR75_14610 [Rhodopseudomonas sp. P2A-2r]|uniref:hypothetical protein n=1 Tax=Rhodopseudomonas sp. P2A-2r TaxID=2991972 RepID=UPI002234D3C9|nr:hypothetical protein [Rhodopseudomonas sp. P2A-2r]UZE52427.1 hypothetical protein ONR75_14610 [Rhodopseudomonas sp. P2A-2r]